MGQAIDGKAIARDIREGLKEQVTGLGKRGIRPCLAVVMVGDYEPSRIYVRMKERGCQETGIGFVRKEFKQATREDLIRTVRELNQDPSVSGIIVQLPLPEGIDEESILNEISPDKDVDGFGYQNMGRLFRGGSGLAPCTPLGVMELIRRSGIDLKGKEVVIINRSNVVGKPLSMMMLKESATVTLCHSKTRDLKAHTSRADVLVSATGVAGMIKPDMVKEGAVVIDVGITRTENGLSGDVDFGAVKDKASLITPVPGGVGPMTVAMVLSNTVKAAEMQAQAKEASE